MPINDDEVSCPWCDWRIDRTVHPLSDDTAESRLEQHKARCPNRRSPSHERVQIDIHGDAPFGDTSNQ
jgi:hypothetical protein